MNSIERVAHEAFGAVSDADIDALHIAMDTAGVGIIRDVIPEATLAEARAYVQRELEAHRRQYFGYTGLDWLDDSPLAFLGQSPHFRSVLTRLYERGTGRPAPDVAMHPSLRVLSGELGLRHANLFHYDSFAVTVLLPIAIPSAPNESRGDLVMYPNLRQVRFNALVNIAEKAIVESTLARRFWSLPRIRDKLGARLVRMEPGNLYVFWGMRSLHANEACLPRSVRATAVFHYGDPHAGTVLKHLSARRHQARLIRMSRPVER